MSSLAELVDRGLALRAQVAEMEEEISLIESRLRQAALSGEQVELEDPDRDGRQYLAHGSEMVVPVVLTADLIVGSFLDASPQHARLQSVAGEHLGQFYRPITTWKGLSKTGKSFRREAAAILGPKAPEFITAATARDKHGIPKSQIKVEWDRAAQATQP